MVLINQVAATASVWDNKSKANIPRLMKFMNDFGLITARDPKGEYLL
jgi:aconitate hydratase 2/2-methylisocitrate dehydratase